jgi:hypothetical protein
MSVTCSIEGFAQLIQWCPSLLLTVTHYDFLIISTFLAICGSITSINLEFTTFINELLLSSNVNIPAILILLILTKSENE